MAYPSANLGTARPILLIALIICVAASSFAPTDVHARRPWLRQLRGAESFAKQAAKQAAAKAAANKRALTAVVVLPPIGVAGGDVAIAAANALKVITGEAAVARIGNVLSVADYNRAQSEYGPARQCDFPCRLAVARKLAARWAIGTSIKRENGRFFMQSVLWRTIDMGQDGTIKVSAPTLARLSALYASAAGDLFNSVRILPLAKLKVAPATPPPAGAKTPAIVDVATEPTGARLWLDGKPIGVSPRRLELAPGWHRLQFQLAARRLRGGLIHVQHGQTGKVTMVLPPLPKPAATPIGRGTAADRSSRAEPERADRKATATPVERPGAPDGIGWVWGVVGHAAGSIGAFEARTTDGSGGADISLGAGLFGHIGYATVSAPNAPWVSFAAGAKYVQWQGFHSDSSGASAPQGIELFAAVMLPRMWGIAVGLHRQWLGNSAASGLHGFNFWSAGAIRTRGLLFARAAVEGRLSSDRAIGLDPFGQGPVARLVLELGLNFGGVKLNY